MEKEKAYCHQCKKTVEIKEPLLLKLRNNKSKSGTIEALQGRCDCGNKIYKIVGHG